MQSVFYQCGIGIHDGLQLLWKIHSGIIDMDYGMVFFHCRVIVETEYVGMCLFVLYRVQSIHIFL